MSKLRHFQGFLRLSERIQNTFHGFKGLKKYILKLELVECLEGISIISSQPLYFFIRLP